MEYEKWDEVLAPYNNAVEELKVKFKNIRKEFLTKGEYSPIEFVTGRTKKIASIVSKAKRLNIQDIEAEMEDIAGIRIMCQFVEDIYNIVNLIKLRSDMTIVYEKDYIKNFKDSGYRSYHVIIKYPINSIAGSKEIDVYKRQIFNSKFNYHILVYTISIFINNKNIIPKGGIYVLQKRKKINNALITLMFLALLIIGTYFISNRYKKESIYKDNIKVINTLTQVLDISTVKYNYSNIVEIKKDKSISNIKIPFTEKSFIVKYNGVINGGVKPEDIEIVSNTGDEIIIEIKTCQILDHYIDDENIYVYDVKNSIFNKLDIQEILEDISNCKKEYEEKIISEGFMEEIQKNTIVSIQNILKGIGYKTVVINFK